jgi:hypothetical protein
VSKLSREKLQEYERDILQGMATDIAKKVFGDSTVKEVKNRSKEKLIKFILDNQEE